MQTTNCGYLSCTHNLNGTPIEKKHPCAYCNSTFYCSINCRILDWETFHKKTCRNGPGPTEKEVSPAPGDNSLLDTSSLSTNSGKKRSLQDYEIVHLNNNKFVTDLGKGSFGHVKLVKEKANPEKLYALKIINKKHIIAYSNIDFLKREVKIHRKLDHPHIIKLYNYFEDKENVYLLLEYAENGNLFFYLRRKRRISEDEAFVYFFQTCLGIDYLHKKGILHRDLKPENLLLDKDRNIKLCDFGYSAEDMGKRNTFCGTVDYMAPEIIQKGSYNYKVDIWSLGVLLYELLHGYAPFKGQTNDEKFKNILENAIVFEGVTEEAKDLIKSLLKSNPDERAEFVAIFEHPWLKRHERNLKLSLNDFIYHPSPEKKMDNILNKSFTDDSAKKDSKTESNKAQESPKPYSSILKNYTQTASSPVAISDITIDKPKGILKTGTFSSKPLVQTGLTSMPQAYNSPYNKPSDTNMPKDYKISDLNLNFQYLQPNKTNLPGALEMSIYDKSPKSLSPSPLNKKDNDFIKDVTSFLESSTAINSKTHILDQSISKETGNNLTTHLPRPYLDMDKSNHILNNTYDRSNNTSRSPSAIKGENRAQQIIDEIMGSFNNTPRNRSPLGNDKDGGAGFNAVQPKPKSFIMADKLSDNNGTQEKKRKTTTEILKVDVETVKQQEKSKPSSIENVSSDNIMTSSTRRNKFLQDYSYPVPLNDKPKSIQTMPQDLPKTTEIKSNKELPSNQISQTSTNSKVFDVSASSNVLPTLENRKDYSKIVQKGEYETFFTKLREETDRLLNKELVNTQDIGALSKPNYEKNSNLKQNDQKKPDLPQNNKIIKNIEIGNTNRIAENEGAMFSFRGDLTKEQVVQSQEALKLEESTDVKKEKTVLDSKNVHSKQGNTFKVASNVEQEVEPRFEEVNMSFGNLDNIEYTKMTEGPQLFESLNTYKPAFSLKPKSESLKKTDYQTQEVEVKAFETQPEKIESKDNNEDSDNEGPDMSEKEAALEILNSSLDTDSFIRKCGPGMAQRFASEKDHLSDLKKAFKSEHKRHISEAFSSPAKNNSATLLTPKKRNTVKDLFRSESRAAMRGHSQKSNTICITEGDSVNRRLTYSAKTENTERSKSPFDSPNPGSQRKTLSRRDFEEQRQTVLNDYKTRLNNLSTFGRATMHDASKTSYFIDDKSFNETSIHDGLSPTKGQKSIGSKGEVLSFSYKWKETHQGLKASNKNDSDGLQDMMDYLDWEDHEKVSRPSWKNTREIPQVQEKPKSKGGFIEKISSFVGCVGRRDNPVRVRGGNEK